MTISRRTVLMGLAWGGLAAPVLAGAIPAFASAAPVGAGPTLVLVPAGGGGSGFVHGVRAAAGDASLLVREAQGDLSFLREFEGLLRAANRPRIIGLLDDGVATPLLDVARGVGVRMPWLGQHSAGPNGVLHRCQAAADGSECARRLADADARHGEAWAGPLGYLLGGLGLPARIDSPSLLPPGSSLSGSFVSFLIQA